MRSTTVSIPVFSSSTISTSSTEATSSAFSTGVLPSHAPSGRSTTARATSWRNAASARNAPLKPCHELTKASISRRRPASFGRSCMTEGTSLATLIDQVELFRGADVVQPADRQSIRGALHLRGILFGLALNRNHRLDEPVELLLRLGLGRLDQQALRHEQREVSGRRVEAVIEQPLGEVHRVDAELLRLPLERDDELVARTTSRVGGVESCLLQTREHVVGVECSVFGDALHAGATEHAHVDVRAQQHAGV